MDTDLDAAAEERFEQALQERNARDPREYYRERLRELREADPGAYEEAVGYYRETLIPSIASGEADPLDAWREYGRRLAELTAPGRTVEIDATGRSEPYGSGAPGDRLVLHLPEDSGRKALLVSLPPDPSEAQRATYRLLVAGRQTLGSG